MRKMRIRKRRAICITWRRKRRKRKRRNEGARIWEKSEQERYERMAGAEEREVEKDNKKECDD